MRRVRTSRQRHSAERSFTFREGTVMHPFTRWAVRGSLAVATAAAALAPLAHARNDNAYTVRALVSDGTLADTTHDPLLVNPWGVAFNPTGFVWVADNATGASTLYD